MNTSTRTTPTYQHFRIHLLSKGEGRYEVTAHYPDGQWSESIAWPGVVPCQAPDHTARTRVNVSHKLGLTFSGQSLFNTLFVGKIHEAFIRHNAHGRLRLTIHLPDELICHQRHWEQLCNGKHWFGRDPEFSLVRGLPGDRRRHKPPPASPRILLVGSQPKDAVPLDIAGEIARIQAVVPDHWHVEVIANATVPILREKLTEGWDILHFMAHGEGHEAGLDLQDEFGQTEVLDSRTFEDLLLGVSRDKLPQLIIFNSCFGGSAFQEETQLDGLARSLIAHGVPYVVAMTGAIEDQHATCFSAALFKALAEGKTLDEAVVHGRRSIRHDECWYLPALFSAVEEEPWSIPTKSHPESPPLEQPQPHQEPSPRPQWLRWALALVLLGTLAILGRFAWPVPDPTLEIALHNQLQGGTNHIFQPSLLTHIPAHLPVVAAGSDAEYRLDLTVGNDYLAYEVQDAEGTLIHKNRVHCLADLGSEAWGYLVKVVADTLLLEPFQKDTNLESELVQWLIDVSQSMLQQGQLEMAKMLLGFAEPRDPQGIAAANLAVLYLLEGAKEEALEYADKANHIQHHPAPLYTLANALADVDPAKAIGFCRKVLLIDPYFEDARQLLGRLLMQAGQLQPAETEFQALIDTNPTFSPAHHALADLAMERQHWQQALGLLADSSRFSPLTRLDLHLEILDKQIRCLQMLGQNTSACLLFKVSEKLHQLYQHRSVETPTHTYDERLCPTPELQVLLVSGSVTLDGRPIHAGQALDFDQILTLADDQSQLLMADRGKTAFFQGPLRLPLPNYAQHQRPFQPRRWQPHVHGDLRIIQGSKGGQSLTLVLPRGRTQPLPDIVWITDSRASAYRISFSRAGLAVGSKVIRSEQIDPVFWFAGTLDLPLARIPWPFDEQPIDSNPEVRIQPFYPKGVSGLSAARSQFSWFSFDEQPTLPPDLVGADPPAQVRHWLTNHTFSPLIKWLPQLADAHPTLVGEALMTWGLLEQADHWFALANEQVNLSKFERGRLLWAWGRLQMTLKSFDRAIQSLRSAAFYMVQANRPQAREQIELQIRQCQTVAAEQRAQLLDPKRP